jgi:predicted nucleotide-binding protein
MVEHISRSTISAALDILKTLGHAGFQRLPIEWGLPITTVEGASLAARVTSLAHSIFQYTTAVTPEGMLISEAAVRRAAAEWAARDGNLQNVSERESAAFVSSLRRDGFKIGPHGELLAVYQPADGTPRPVPPVEDDKRFVVAAFRDLSANGKRCYVHSVPTAIEAALMRANEGRITSSEAVGRVRRVLAHMISNGEIVAPAEPQIDWVLNEAQLASAQVVTVGAPKASTSRQVFVVHGHDEAMLQAVARFLERAGLEPVILKERASRGDTIIEKIERCGDVGFAIVLLSPDDHGAKLGEALQSRARQNVLLELGYFFGRLERSKVCVLKKGNLEFPTDFAGVIWNVFDEAEGWKQKLLKELEDAGYSLNWKKALAT